MTDKLKDYKDGDRARITIEGRFKKSAYTPSLLFVPDGTDTGGTIDQYAESQSFTIEKLSTPPVVGDRVTWGAGYTNDWRLVAIVDGRAIMWNGLKSLDRPIEEVRKEVEQ